MFLCDLFFTFSARGFLAAEIAYARAKTVENGADAAEQAKYPPKQRSAEYSQQAGRTYRQQIKPPGDEVCSHNDAGMSQDHHCRAVSFPTRVDQRQADQPGRTDDQSPEHEKYGHHDQPHSQRDGDITSLMHGVPLLVC